MKGTFLHLVTDYIFFNDFFETDYLENITYNDFLRNLYYSYDCTNEYLQKKYQIDLSTFGNKLHANIINNKKQKNISINNNHITTNILNEKKVDDFIERVSNINLQEYKEKVLKFKTNILP